MKPAVVLLAALFVAGGHGAKRLKRQDDGGFWWLKDGLSEDTAVRSLNQTVVDQILQKGPTSGSASGFSPHPGKCVCIPFHLCSNEGEIITDGAGVIDIRIINKKPDGTTIAGPSIVSSVGEVPKLGEPQLVGGNCQGVTEVCCTVPTVDQNPDVVDVPDKSSYTAQCGVRNVDGINVRVVGFKDQESQYGEFPWMVAVLNPAPNKAGQIVDKYVCGGSLIHPQVVLTAAHCVSGRDPGSLKIRVGEWDTQSEYEFYAHQDIAVIDQIVHEGYIKANLFNDLALLILERPVDLGPEADTVCMPLQGQVFDTSRCIATGWGKDLFGQEGKYQHVLKRIELPVVPRANCQNSLRTTRLGQRFALHDSFICAGGEKGKDTCKGDGGSPLVCPVKTPGGTRYVQAGIVAWGVGCGENGVPGVYVNIARFVSWIDAKVSERLKIAPKSYFGKQITS